MISQTRVSNINLPALAVVYEDNHLLVINKPPGDLVQGDRTGDLPLVEKAKAYIKHKYNKKGNVFLGVVHRLDRPTSGVLVFARTSKALSRLNSQFQERAIQKTYWAVVEGRPKKNAQTLEHWLLRKPRLNKSFAHSKEIAQSKWAKLDYILWCKLNNYSGLEVNLHTGRHHQIRSQLSAIGHPIKGDLKYGAARSNPNGSIHLHARELTLHHPTTNEKMTFKAAPPNDAVWQACLDEHFG